MKFLLHQIHVRIQYRGKYQSMKHTLFYDNILNLKFAKINEVQALKEILVIE